jgi:hypothetical protein
MKETIKKKNTTDSIEIDLDYACGDKPYCINKLINYLVAAKDIGATHVEIYPSNYEVDYVDIQPITQTLETDEEYEKRKAYEESRKLAAENIKKAKEKALYEELKEKYG